MPNCTDLFRRIGSIRIEVIDQGPGLSQQAKETLFHQGVQLDPTQLQSGQGEISMFHPIHSISLVLIFRIRTWVMDLKGHRQYSWWCHRGQVR
jgi:hypothetical protein